MARADVNPAVETDGENAQYRSHRHDPVRFRALLRGEIASAQRQQQEPQWCFHGQGYRVEQPKSGIAAAAQQIGWMPARLMPLGLTNSGDQFGRRDAVRERKSVDCPYDERAYNNRNTGRGHVPDSEQLA